MLFDGRSLAGWYWEKGEAVSAPGWEARDGLLATTPGRGKAVYLLTREEFEDFDFRFEWRAEAGANSGVKCRIQMFGDSMRRLELVGLECGTRVASWCAGAMWNTGWTESGW